MSPRNFDFLDGSGDIREKRVENVDVEKPPISYNGFCHFFKMAAFWTFLGVFGQGTFVETIIDHLSVKFPH